MRDPWWPLTDHSGGGGARVAARPSRGEREAHHGRPVGLPTDQCELEEVVGEVNDGGRGDGDRDGGKEEGEGRHQKRAEPEKSVRAETKSATPVTRAYWTAPATWSGASPAATARQPVVFWGEEGNAKHESGER